MPSSTPKAKHHYDEDPATVRSVNHQRLRIVSIRLTSIVSARNIISIIQRRQIVHRLDIGDSCLGDDGCVQLFNFLESPAGQKYRISLTELYLTRNDITAKGLLAISNFVNNNHVLRELCLSGNPLSTDPDVIAHFTAALNTSRLCTLQLIHNNTLSDPFIRAFLPSLTTPYLRQLDLSAINLTRAAVPTIIEYVSSPRCRLDRLQCNANSLTLSGAAEIISAIQSCNYSLVKLNLEDLHVDDVDITTHHIINNEHNNNEGQVLEDRNSAWQRTWRILDYALKRNMSRKNDVKKQAVGLLSYGRALLLRSPSMRDMHVDPNPNPRPHSSPSSFVNMPTEIQQEISAFLAPDLSHRQRTRVLLFAADITTLPALVAPPHSNSNPAYIAAFMRTVSFPAAVVTNCNNKNNILYEGSWKPPVWWECRCSAVNRRYCRTLRRWERERRDVWLARVGCDVWESEFPVQEIA